MEEDGEKNNISDMMLIRELLKERPAKMRGMNIRTYQKCPKCKGKFQETKIGFICPVDLTRPTRFLIDLWYEGKNSRVYCDKQGVILDTYHRATILQTLIAEEIKEHTFDPSKYFRSEQSKFWVKNLLDEFLKYKLKEIRPGYKANYKAFISTAKEYWGVKDVREIRRADLIGYKEYLQKEKASPKTVKNYLVNFKTFMNWLKNDVERIANVPKFPEVIVQKKIILYAGEEQQGEILEHIAEENQDIIRFMMLHGCRPSEARALRAKNVNLKNGKIRIDHTFSGGLYMEGRKNKRSKPYEIKIHSECLEYITQRVKNNLPEAWLFPNPRTGRHYSQEGLRQVYDRARKEMGIVPELKLKNVTRHSVGTNLRKAGVPLEDIQEQLGHEDPKSTLIYAHPDEDQMKANIEKLSLKKKVVEFPTHCEPTMEKKAVEK